MTPPTTQRVLEALRDACLLSDTGWARARDLGLHTPSIAQRLGQLADLGVIEARLVNVSEACEYRHVA